jgi:hypothetical protein
LKNKEIEDILLKLFAKDSLNNQALAFKLYGDYLILTCARIITIGQTITRWNLLVISFQNFDCLVTFGRGMTQKEYKVLKSMNLYEIKSLN